MARCRASPARKLSSYWSAQRQAATYPGRASIPVFVAHPPNEVACCLRLDRHRIGHRLQRRNIDALARAINRGDLRNGFAASRDAHRLAGGSAFDQLAQTRLRVGEAHCYHPQLLTNYLVTSTTSIQAACAGFSASASSCCSPGG